MIFRLHFICWLLLFTTTLFGQTSLQGTVIDETGEPILFGIIKLSQDGELKMGGQTDFDGNYKLIPIEPGIYDVEFLYIGYDTARIDGVIVKEGVVNHLDIELSYGAPLEVIEIGRNCYPQPGQLGTVSIREDDLIRMLESPYYITSYEKGVVVIVNEEVRELELWMEDELIAKWRKRKPGEYKVKVKELPAGQILKLISGTNDFECQAVY